MREIEFRAKDFEGNWCKGFFFPSVSSEQEVYWCIMDLEEHELPEGAGSFVINPVYEVDPNNLGQYTGLKDANGVKIFEKDIAGSATQGFGLVTWYPKKLMYCLMRESDDGLFFLREISQQDFVIGNIHDNPELI